MNVAYVYPWDVVGDPTAPTRLAELGVDTIALAAAYHSTRAVTPYHPAHRVLDVPHPAFYLPIRLHTWSRLVPAAPTWTPPDAYLQAQTALRRAGLKVHAWIVLTHNSYLGTRFPDLVVRNAFGDPYPYALCPAHEDVLEYCETLVTETLTLAEPDGLILEACGPMGFTHQSIHEKTSGADWTPTDTDLLSLCFCRTCTPHYPSETAPRIRTILDHPATTSPETDPYPPKADTMDHALGPLTDEVRAIRVRLSAALRHRLLSAARTTAPTTPITLHANPTPWATGPFAALPDGDPDLDVLVGNCWGDTTTDAARLTALANLCTPGQRVGAYVLALPPRPADATTLTEHLKAYAHAGASEFHLYHAGLASPQRLSALTNALRHLP
ncbi:hypothetical protein ACFFV7_25075 [Nonomuraea spiralis]|uniref:Alanine-rich protein n=1 Tax=Nonomuraea spiralis TaxID=46182 RepID=A0ABV5IIX8_9ACTN|nr:hypothetical protein [Nonomuraea spiralis]GGT12921.1 hypothetical protein GCM10010176_066920 [Nonomuraea spiralis]